ncbi:MAG: ribosome-associated translation inhibitor RaiA [Desulfovibrio sp.]|jgi:putative sigma-54 modulation protein|uniref:ribosome hibernation-promoting factor, HPF/YfiA family n=1 Tax=uncultured Desulfovibrio sp. TaxID=167968 RepID=UPI001B0CE398|nr:ribosome-associated translation inhibitor RaiA [uncultured Desulfovibrio sp.]MBE6440944.1 ribosome-associated translation inhibitor RaiA [Desulfovibrio desulfuricans]MBO5491400.1 ribosome-associated translation inhibitor RaiA [Desulfovibrio sp.]MBO6171383.1 ribosome-associated translation inhibitor RaiA [Desulfovibrio sp.]
MNISFAFKNFEASDHLKKYARRRMEKLGRFFGKSSGLEVAVVLTVDKFRHRCEVTVTGEGLHINASEQTSDMYAAIDLVTDKVEAQIKRQVSRAKSQRRRARNTEVDVFSYNLDTGESASPELAEGSDRLAAKPLHLDEALMQLDSVGGEFLVFFNAENNRINVVYRTKVGGYALIDPVL